mmetsp:Transcript_2826/g.7018  ORF Transcript_2826/g.7018 Transcript_2826/m.7018 type:complete len:214 (+) Transcript_2826:1563-2204(+)
MGGVHCQPPGGGHAEVASNGAHHRADLDGLHQGGRHFILNQLKHVLVGMDAVGGAQAAALLPAERARLEEQRQERPHAPACQAGPRRLRARSVAQQQAAPQRGVALPHVLVQLHIHAVIQQHDLGLGGIPGMSHQKVPCVRVSVDEAGIERHVGKDVQQELGHLLCPQTKGGEALQVGNLAAVHPLHRQHALRAQRGHQGRRDGGARRAAAGG